jgi:cytochrome bd-type quinol oxidase subunit 1
MTRLRAHPILAIILLVALVFTLAAGSFGFYLANEAGRLPWQVDPTRIPVTPFSDFPGFNAPSTPVSTPGA